jgi:hypothetical protein
LYIFVSNGSSTRSCSVDSFGLSLAESLLVMNLL